MRGERSGCVLDAVRDAGCGVTADAGEYERSPAREVLVDRHLPRSRLVRRRQVVAPARARERQHEVGAGTAVSPDARGPTGLERNPLVTVRVGVGPRGRGDVGRRVGERRGRPRDLAEEIECELQPAGRTAVLVLIPMPVRVRDAVRVEAVGEGPGRVDGATQPGGSAVARVSRGECERGELHRECGTERPGRASPRHRSAVPRADREHQVERGAEARVPSSGPMRGASGSQNNQTSAV